MYIIILIVLVFGSGCSSSSGDMVKKTKVGKDRGSDPYFFSDSVYDMKKKEKSEHPYLLNDSPERVLRKGSGSSFYSMPLYDEKAGKKEFGKRRYDSFWEGTGYTEKEKERVTPYIVESPYVADESHDYLSIFKLYNKPKIRAFLVGNAAYEVQSLRYSINDVNLFRVFLEEVLSVPGDRIFTHENLSLSSFMESFTSFLSTIKEGELVLIYFSGHSREDGSPIFVDMKSIEGNSFYSLLNAFSNDTVLIMDSSYLEGDIVSDEDLYYDVRNVLEVTKMRDNVLRLYSNLVHRYNKEGKYKNHFMLRKYLKKTYGLLGQMGVSSRGNGIFTLFLMSFFADFSYFTVPSFEVTYETVYSYMNNMLSLIEEERGVAEGVVLARPKKYPFISANFRDRENDYILFKGTRETLYDNESLVLRAMYRKAIEFKQGKKYKLAVSLFSNVLALGGDYRQSRQLLSSSYLSLASVSDRPDEALGFYNNALKYDPDSLYSLYGLAGLYNGMGRSDEARSLLMEIKAKLQERPDSVLQSKLDEFLLRLDKTELSPYELLRRGYHSYNRKEFDKALDYFVRAKSGFKKENNSFYVATCLNNIGSVYTVRGDYKRSLSFSLESLEIKNRIEDFEGIANSYNNIGVIYHKQGVYEKAIMYFNRSIALFKRLKFRDKLVARSYVNLGNLYFKMGNYSKAYVNQKEAVWILTAIKDFSVFKEKKKLKIIENKLL